MILRRTAAMNQAFCQKGGTIVMASGFEKHSHLPISSVAFTTNLYSPGGTLV